MRQGSNAMIGHIVGRPVNRMRLAARTLHVLYEPRSRCRGHVALQKDVKEEIDHFGVAAALMSPSHRSRVGSAAIAVVAGRGQSQRQVLPQQERLAVEPGTTSVPTRHRGWKEQLLTK